MQHRQSTLQPARLPDRVYIQRDRSAAVKNDLKQQIGGVYLYSDQTN